MREALAKLIRQPISGADLDLEVFERLVLPDGAEDVREGVLVSANGDAYPVMGGVPIMLPAAFSEDFVSRHRAAIAASPKLSGISLGTSAQDWSFSREWDAHFDTNSERTWGHTVKERLEQLLMETETSPDWFRQKMVLDAGCGNGALSGEVAGLGATVVGLDFSSSVRPAEGRRESGHVHFLQGDLQAPPLGEGSFDLVFSIGVLHHTPDTLTTFRAVARLVKPGGRFYVWLYRRPERFLGRYVKTPMHDLARAVISRCPPAAQNAAVNAYARLVRATHNLRNADNPVPLREYIVSAFDDLTCRWRYYHTPIEVCRWFHECGYSAPTFTHWDNPYGFGLVATKLPQSVTPGIHYGTGAKLWDESRTLLGRLHAD
jgi:2-polyprenyl-3-methyl-5-hydroxy-6-metoxy-1,4-benzoquinol methylase/uncharacterized protein YbaR (Trm112 family)